MEDISIDLETLSTRHDAAILSIGAVAFDRTTGETGPEYYTEIAIDSAVKNGHVSGDTLEWWLKQSVTAQRVFAAGEKAPLDDALAELRSFVEQFPGVRVWGNGATFDITILETAYRRHNAEAPWEFRNVRDMRTIVDAAAMHGFDKASVQFDGVEHHALHDAVHQAKVISLCWRALTPATVKLGAAWV